MSGGSFGGPSRRPSGGHSLRLKAIVAAIASAAVVAAVIAVGIVPGVSLLGVRHPSPPSPFASSSAALGIANPLAIAHGSGALILAAGIAPIFSFAFGKVAGNATCPIEGGLSQNFTVPAEVGGYSSGKLALWLFLYYDAATPSESSIAVTGSTGYFLGTLSGVQCLPSTYLPAIPVGTIDSTRAAANASADAGSYLALHTASNALYTLVDNATVGPEWAVVYSNCSYNPQTNRTTGGTKGDLFDAVVNGLNGRVLGASYLPGSANCSALIGSGSLLPTGSALALEGGTLSARGQEGHAVLSLALAPAEPWRTQSARP